MFLRADRCVDREAYDDIIYTQQSALRANLIKRTIESSQKKLTKI